MPANDEHLAMVKSIRHFNRYYTNRLGLLSRYRFDTKMTLTEARVLFEIGRRGAHTQSGLAAFLKIDGGYLNRIVKRLVEWGLVEPRPDEQDGRVLLLRLTEKGRRTAAEIDAASDAEAASLVADLDPKDIRVLVGHLRAAEKIIERRAARKSLIDRVEGGAGIETARVLMREYAAFLGTDLSFQGFEEELANLPGKYAPPSGALFLASVPTGAEPAAIGVEPAGCVAVRKLEDGICEMKRLFVRPEYRGYGLGRALAERSLEAARELGYRTMRLDTLERLEGAVALYEALGFKRIAPYCVNPLPGAMFWEKRLD